MAKKKTKPFLPKKIGGVRVPKKARSGRFGELLASPTGQKLIAEAILGAGAIIAGATAAKNPKVQRKAARVKHRALDAGEDATSRAGATGAAIAHAIGEAARSFTEALRDRDERGASAPAAEAPEWSGYAGKPAPAKGGDKPSADEDAATT